MFWIDTIILIGSVLLLLAVLSIKFSSRLGMPVLVAFLFLGMLAGSDGIGGIEFEDYSLSYAIGNVVLVIILYSGGLATPLSAIRYAWKPAGLLATVGVFVTAIVTGLAAAWILNLPLTLGLLLGSIVGSTDASAVFSILRAGGIHIRRSLADTLEVESGSNDPMAIFLTVGLIEYLTGNLTHAWGAFFLLANQLIVGLAIGVVIGYVAVWALNKVQLEVAGLYPILAMAFGLISYGLAAELGGSGFLSTYLTGIVVGNRRIPFNRGIQSFHDASAWLGQIMMFVLLGMLSFPSRLVGVLLPGLAIAIVLMFIARPLAVYFCLLRTRFVNREKLFLSWVGLKGAVPITLAIFPLMNGIEGAATIFDVVFFIVIISAILQGSTLKWVAQFLRLDVPPKREPPITLEISSLHEVDADIVDYYIDADSQVAGKRIRDLALPAEVVIALVVRHHQSRLPKGSFRIEADDHVIVVVNRGVRQIVDRIFSRLSSDKRTVLDWPVQVEFPLRGSVRLRALNEFYSIKLAGVEDLTIDQWLRQQIADQELAVGLFVDSSGARLRIRELDPQNQIDLVGLTFVPEQFFTRSDKNSPESGSELTSSEPTEANIDEKNEPPTEQLKS
ncbi:MAG: potassium/proton antiporter [Pirellulaceae bacterium]|nr:potassium/proton antiporter [Pirellulaceae bacterium]